MEPIENKEVRGITGKLAFAVFFGWSSLMCTTIFYMTSIKSEIRDNRKDAETDKKLLQYQIDNIRQTTELNNIQIKDLNKRIDDQEIKQLK